MKKILLLSHQGTGFVDKFVACFKELKQDYIVLASIPESTQEYAEAWEQKGYVFHRSSDHEITKSDIDRLCADHQFDCCITVWEGYRNLMAYANHLVGALDIGPDVVNSVQDKYRTRQSLYQSNLSNVRSYSIAEFRNQYSGNNNERIAKHFIKPKRGLGSLNCHSISSFEDIDKSITSFDSATSNVVFNEFYLANELYLEEYIDGIEVSFELLVHQGEILFWLEHEKYGMHECAQTVLEKSVVSPSLSLTTQQISNGVMAVSEIMKNLGLTFGCYHVEMKYTSKDRWELIEVNPRVGGALIHDSTQYRTGSCMLKMWLRSLLGEQQTDLQRHLPNYTYFEVEYAQSGKKVLEINRNPNYPEPEIAYVMTSPGMVYEHADMEIFTGMHLWVLKDKTAMQEMLDKVNQGHVGYLEVNYTD